MNWLIYDTSTVSGVGKTPSNPAAEEGWPNVQNTGICCQLFRTGFRSYDRRQCFGFLLGDLGLTSLIVVGGGYRVAGWSLIIQSRLGPQSLFTPYCVFLIRIFVVLFSKIVVLFFQNCCVVLCFVYFVLFYVLFVCKCVLPPGDNPIAVNKYIISYQTSSVSTKPRMSCKLHLWQRLSLPTASLSRDVLGNWTSLCWAYQKRRTG